jgi:hypothetical protein
VFEDTTGSSGKKVNKPSFLLEATFAYDPKVVRLRRLASSEEEGWFWCAIFLATVGHLRVQGLSLSEESLSDVAYSLHLEEEKYRHIVDQMVAAKLLQRKENIITCEALSRRVFAYEKKCAILRENGRKGGSKKKANSNACKQLLSKPEANAKQAQSNLIKYNRSKVSNNNGSKIIIPESLNTPEVRSTLKEWYLDRKERKKKPTDRAVTLILKKYSSKTPEQFIDALRYSIEQGYTGVFEPPSRLPESKREQVTQVFDDFLKEN